MQIIRKWLTRRDMPALKDVLFLLLVFGTAFFLNLGRLPLIEPDEGRYAEIPREMLERGDFITPLLNYVKYFEKPPLHYWLNAAAMSIFGKNEFAARCSGALMGLLSILLVYHVGRKLFGRRSGFLGALVLGTCTGFLIQARLNITDMTLTCTLSASLAFFAVAARETEQRKGLYYHLSYACAALAVLAKGLIGIVFPGAIIFLYLLLSRRWRILREMRLLTGLSLFFAIAAPWFVAVSAKNPEFAWFFFIHEHFQRFTTTVHGRYQPFWFFVPVLIGTMLPWSLFIPAGIRRIWQQRTSVEGSSRLYLATWVAFVFVFFSKSDSKLIPYILPVFPALALLIGYSLDKALDEDMPSSLKLQGFVAGTVCTILGAGAIVYPHVASKPALDVGASIIIGSLFLAEGICALAAARRRSVIVLTLALCSFSYVLGIVAPVAVMPRIAQRKSSRELALLIRDQAGKDAVVASFGYDQGLPFYSNRRIIVVGDPNELAFGSRIGDQSTWFIDSARFSELWNGQAPVFALLSQGELDQLQGKVKGPIREIARSRRKVLISNR